jgi:hypothetical protein
MQNNVMGLDAELDIKGYSVTTCEHFSRGSRRVSVFVCDFPEKSFVCKM